jgi:hypothetical protein
MLVPSARSQLVESSNLIIINKPADLTDAKLKEMQGKLYQGDQGQDYPLPSLLPVTIAFQPSSEPYKLGEMKMGYYTMLLGLGSKPYDVVVTGTLSVGDDIQNVDNVFFKGLRNLKFDGNLQWWTSQMSPIRYAHIGGNIDLGGGVGGLLADTLVEGQITDGGQQEYLFRNVSATEGLAGRAQHSGQMNFVLVDSNIKTRPDADVCADTTTCGSYYPAKHNPAPSFAVDSLPNPIEDKHAPLITPAGVISRGVLHTNFIQIKSQKDLDGLTPAAGSVIVIHPGVYMVTKTLALTGDGITVLGLGFPILRSHLADATIKITGRNCVLASLIVDVPLLTFDQNIMIDVTGSDAELYDVCGRTMLAWNSPVQKMKTGTMLHIDAPGTFVENIWLWRGDHWSGPDLEGSSFGNTKWDSYNINPYGLHVDVGATGVTCLGAFVEHQLWNPIVWDGDAGVLVMSQGECAYTNNGNTSPDVAGTVKPLSSSLTPGVYYSIGATVQKHTFIGGGIYNIFGEQYTQSAFPAIEVLAKITKDIDINRCMIAGWVDTKHFESIMRYQGTDYGPALMGGSVSFYLCDVMKLLGDAPAPAPPPPECKDVKCILSSTDYWGNLPGWPRGEQKQKYDPNMDPGQCCGICAQDAKCTYWKEANGNCFTYENPSSVPRDVWKNFTSNHPTSAWNVGVRDDVCCKCQSGSNACGPTTSNTKVADMNSLSGAPISI